MITRFEPVKVQASKSGKCLCGKRLTKSKTFEQTINPFNKNAAGEVKSGEEILEELRATLRVWRDFPVYHELKESYWRWPEAVRNAYDNGETVRLEMTCGEKRPYVKGEIA